MIRATTGGVLKSYRRNLMNSFIAQNKARDTVLSQRNFNSYAEDPAAAAKAFRLRKSRMTVESQHDICSDTMKKYETGFSCLQSIDEVLDTKGGEYGKFMKTLHGATLTWLNDTNGDAREQLTKAFSEMSEMLVQTMNQKYGDNFIFAGADGHNVPFEVKQENGQNKLYYRGVPVDVAVPNVLTDGATPPAKVVTNAGTYVPANANTLSQQAYNDGTANGSLDSADYTSFIYTDDQRNTVTGHVRKDETMSTADYDKACLEAKKLQYLADEKYFVDIGLGFKEDENGNLIESSGFNASLVGINFLGYGLDEDGDPKNLYSLVQKMKEVSDRANETGDWNSVYDEFHGLVKKFEKACSTFKTAFTNTDANVTKLQNNEKLLKENFYNLQEQYSDIEDVDMVESIESFLWAEYAYNAALKVGNSILSQSLMDYLS